VTSLKENELAPKQVVKPVVASNATDGIGQKELPIAEAMRDADRLSDEASDACVGSGSVDSQAQRLTSPAQESVYQAGTASSRSISAWASFSKALFSATSSL